MSPGYKCFKLYELYFLKNAIETNLILIYLINIFK